jgi:hypothetical protein
MQREEDDKEARGANLVIALAAGAYNTQGFPAAVNAHYHMPMAFPGTVVLNYVFKQVGF